MEWPEATIEARVAEVRKRTTSFESWDDFLRAAREGRPSWRPALEARLRAGMEERNGAVVPRRDPAAAAAAFHWVGVERPSLQRPQLAMLDLPILLVVAARNDTTEQVDGFRSHVPAAEVVTVDSAHDVFADAPDGTAAIVADRLLAQQAPGT